MGILTARPGDDLTAIRDAARRQPGAVIELQPGIYELGAPLRLTAEDSGTTWRAAGEVCLRGSRALREWRPVSDPAVRTRLGEAARERVREVDLAAAGIADIGQMVTQGFGHPVLPKAMELYEDGRRLRWTRWPADGWTTIAGWRQATTEITGQELGDPAAGFLYAGDAPQRWAPSDDLWVFGYWAYDWAGDFQRVRELDTAAGHVVTHPPNTRWGYRTGQRVAFLNVLEELRQPGQFYVDRTSRKAYFWPRAEAGFQLTATVLDQPLLLIEGASDVTIEGLTFEETRGTGVEIHGGERVRLRDCTVRHVGSDAIRVSGGTGHTVERTHVHDTGDGGIEVKGGDRATLSRGDHVVSDCEIHDIAVWTRVYRPAVRLSGVGLTVRHCHLYDHPHIAVMMHGNDHLVEGNRIHHVCHETNDCGAIYIGRDWTARGHLIRGNWIHDVAGTGEWAIGVYLDDLASGVDVIGNLFDRIQIGVQVGGGRDVRIEHNLFRDNKLGITYDGRGLDRHPQWTNCLRMVRENYEAILPSRELYARRYPELFAVEPYLAADAGVPPGNNRVIRNLFACTTPIRIHWHATAETVLMRDNYFGDPGLDEVGRLPANNLARRLGIEPLDPTTAGPRATGG